MSRIDPSDGDVPDVAVTSSRNHADHGVERGGGGTNLLAVPRPQFLTVDNLIQAVSIESLTSTEDDDVIH